MADAILPELRAQTGYKDAEVWLVDLASYQSVLAFAERFKKDGGRLDVLLENAAVAPVMGNTTLTKDGYEETCVDPPSGLDDCRVEAD